jgi:tryptophan-rich sensory protein
LKIRHRGRLGFGSTLSPRERCWAGLSAAVSLLLALVVRLLVGPPYRVITYCNLRGVLPPVWLLFFLWVGWYILLGGAFGVVLGCRSSPDEASKYKGGMLFVLMMALGYVWYPLFFGAAALFFALLVAEAVLVLAVLSALCFMRVKRSAALVMFLFAFFMVYMVVLNILCLFAN